MDGAGGGDSDCDCDCNGNGSRKILVVRVAWQQQGIISEA
jgi:hypothetical protein